MQHTPADGATPLSASPGESLIVVRVPEPDLDTAISRVAAVGTEVSRSATDQDVTGEIADVASRIDTQRASVARTRELLRQASSVQDVVFIESELTKRQADLEALKARLKSLSDRADLATLTVTLRTPSAKVPDGEPSSGFLAGLREGWAALVASTNVVLTVLGALLPVAVVAALVGYPASVLVRRRRAAAPARPAPAPYPAPVARVPVGVGPGGHRAPGPVPGTGSATSDGPAGRPDRPPG